MPHLVRLSLDRRCPPVGRWGLPTACSSLAGAVVNGSGVVEETLKLSPPFPPSSSLASPLLPLAHVVVTATRRDGFQVPTFQAPRRRALTTQSVGHKPCPCHRTGDRTGPGRGREMGRQTDERLALLALVNVLAARRRPVRCLWWG